MKLALLSLIYRWGKGAEAVLEGPESRSKQKRSDLTQELPLTATRKLPEFMKNLLSIKKYVKRKAWKSVLPERRADLS